MEDVIINQLPIPILTVTIFLPLAGAFVLLFIKKESAIRYAALLVSLAVFFVSLPLYFLFDKSTYKMQFVEQASWIPRFNMQYMVGIDGISILFIALTALLTILSVLVSWTSITRKVKSFHIALLCLESFILGAFTALDLTLFYVFWEAMLIPMFLLIGVWGGERRIYSAIKFFLYTLVGSLLMLVAIIVIYKEVGTFNILKLTAHSFPEEIQLYLFLAFFAAFAVKVPMAPLHTWLPDAHTEAPTAGSVILAGVLLKMGAYGFLRFSMPLCPYTLMINKILIMALSVVAIIYGGFICLAQTDMKRLIAYSSVSHMGFVTLGIFTLNQQGLEGGILQMVNHGIITGALFLMIGIVYERTHTRLIEDYGGFASAMPQFSAFFMILTFASIGFPGMNGFVGEFLIIMGAFKFHAAFGVLSATGVIIGATYMLWLYQKVFFQALKDKYKETPLLDLNKREIVLLLPLIFLIFWIGFFPDTLLSYLHSSVQHLMDLTGRATVPKASIIDL
jgi:NADH-quinone oxidoreductase subunit M